MSTTSPWKSIARNAFSLSVADTASKGATGLIGIVLARLIGPELFGKYSTASAVAGLFMLVTQLGFEQQFTRVAGRDPKALSDALSMTLAAVGATVVVGIVALGVFLGIGPYPHDVLILIAILAATQYIGRFHLPFRYVCLVIGRSHVTAAIQGAATAVMFVGTIAFLAAGMSLENVLLFQLIVSVIVLGVWLGWMKGQPEIRPPFPPPPGEFGLFVRESMPFALSLMLWIAYFNIPTFILSLMQPEREVGLYGGVFRIIGINYVLGFALTNTFSPALFRTHPEGPATFAPVARRLMKAMTGLGALSGLGLFLLSGLLVRLLIGAEYMDGVVIAQALSLAVFFRMTNYGLSEVMTASGRQKTRVILETAMLGVNIALNLMLIPRWGGLGSAMACIGAEVFLTVCALTYWKRAVS